ncbi:pyridoxal phosphate-dependent decarboxylase family protein [Arthrobacter sp. UM1]|uniref:pyridoxal phosphate-dependent decarboxylase family protein n=1 Tax=Arthrobacter sp. UM1 TaxID=2766776 RepID=UPI001CF6CF86|nr:pyridoxal-dependent decarboxylase [Arthrobacter sp. UM1]MCB4208845.1 pyridoxal-dependent decarboxylase [Arthrobacter sp. UM1]
MAEGTGAGTGEGMGAGIRTDGQHGPGCGPERGLGMVPQASAADERRQNPLHSSLLAEHTADGYPAWVSTTAARVAEAAAAADRPSTGATPAELERRVGEVDLGAPLGPDEHGLAGVLDELQGLYLDDAVWFHHPRYAMHLNCPVLLPSLAAEAALSGVNSSMDTWDQSAGATMIERRMIAWVAGLIGWGPEAAAGPHGRSAEAAGSTASAPAPAAGPAPAPSAGSAPAPDPDGVFTSGGTQSNLQALLMARGAALAARAAQDPSLLERPLPEQLLGLRIYASEEAHFSVANSAELLGLGRAAVIGIPTTADFRMDPAALRDRLEADARAGLVPMAVVATAGTTDAGAIDPLPEIAEAAREHGAWLHADAAYGGGLLLSEELAPRLAGIELADSVTVDFHKTWFQPVSCSAVLVRDRAGLEHVRHHAAYLNPRRLPDEEDPNQVHKSLQTTRRFDALKLWMSVRTLGRAGLGRLVEDVMRLGREAGEAAARRPELRLAAPASLSTLLFRWAPEGEEPDDGLVERIRARVLAEGRANVASTRVRGVPHLKLTLLNPAMTVEDVEAVLDVVDEAARAVRAEDDAEQTTPDHTTPDHTPVHQDRTERAAAAAMAGGAR